MAPGFSGLKRLTSALIRGLLREILGLATPRRTKIKCANVAWLDKVNRTCELTGTESALPKPGQTPVGKGLGPFNERCTARR